MQRHTSVGSWAERIMELCWLLALIMIPIYFNLLTARHFEPDKAVVLRSLALIIAATWTIKIFERSHTEGRWPDWRAIIRTPMMIPIVIYVGVFALSTVASLMTPVSFWGGYNRLQGFYSNFSYVIVGLAIMFNLRTKEQLQRLVTVIILTALPVAGYGHLQHEGIDPLPWKGDVTTRVASTMGNSIFVSAYVILVVPFVLYQLVVNAAGVHRARSEEGGEGSPGLDLAWGAAFALLIIGQLALFNGVLKLGAVIYSVTLVQWWLYPFAVLVIGSTFPLISARTTVMPRGRFALYVPGLLLLFFGLLMLFGGMLTANACDGTINSGQLCIQEPSTPTESRVHAMDYGTWIAIGYGAFIAAYGLLLGLPRRRTVEPSLVMRIINLAGLSIALVALVITVLYTQSRGPMMGLLAGVVTFSTLALIQAARSAGSPRLRSAMRWLSVGWLAAVLGILAILVVLNTMPTSFQSLRTNTYVNRLSQVGETEGGTGRVRLLIWRGDEIKGGTVDLIMKNPLRTVIGWGPETMFVAYNPYYPPDLAHYESRGASPDRSHQTLLDELVHKGALGLWSYYLVLCGLVMLMLRMLRFPRWLSIALVGVPVTASGLLFLALLDTLAVGILMLACGWLAIALCAFLGYARPVERQLPFTWQVLFIAAIAVMVSHFIESFVGIPIVSTLTYTWVTVGASVAGARLTGALPSQEAEAAAAAAAAAEAEPEPETPVTTQQRPPKRQRGAAGSRKQARVSARRQEQPLRWVAYIALMLVALAGVWYANLDEIYADMRFNQGQQWADGRSIDRELLAYAAYMDAIESSPNEDFYYLYLGRTLLALAQIVGQEQAKQGNQVATMPNNQQLEDLPDVDYDQVLSDRQAMNTLAGWFLQRGSFQVLDYARLAMDQARQISPLNKDHYANLGRIYSTWYRSLKEEPKLDLALANYQEAVKVAPQDVVLQGQYGSLLALRDPQRAAEVLREAIRLDESSNPTPQQIYAPNYLRLAEVLRAQGDLVGATEYYSKAVSIDPRVFGMVADIQANGQQLEQDVLAALSAQEGQLRSFAGGYAAYLERRPDDGEVWIQYTRILSASQDYDAALAASTEGARNQEEILATQQLDPNIRQLVESRLATLRQLITEIQQLAPQGL